jgi:hypothetical protein
VALDCDGGRGASEAGLGLRQDLAAPLGFTPPLAAVLAAPRAPRRGKVPQHDRRPPRVWPRAAGAEAAHDSPPSGTLRSAHGSARACRPRAPPGPHTRRCHAVNTALHAARAPAWRAGGWSHVSPPTPPPTVLVLAGDAPADRGPQTKKKKNTKKKKKTNKKKKKNKNKKKQNKKKKQKQKKKKTKKKQKKTNKQKKKKKNKNTKTKNKNKKKKKTQKQKKKQKNKKKKTNKKNKKQKTPKKINKPDKPNTNTPTSSPAINPPRISTPFHHSQTNPQARFTRSQKKKNSKSQI